MSNLNPGQFGHVDEHIAFQRRARNEQTDQSGYDNPQELSSRLDDMYQPGGEGEINHSLVAKYAEDMKRGDKFPPITVLGSGPTDPGRWVVDGNHRTLAAAKAGLDKIPTHHTMYIDG